MKDRCELRPKSNAEPHSDGERRIMHLLRKTYNHISLIICLTLLTQAGQVHADVEFKKSPHGKGAKITCYRNGLLVYTFVKMGGTNGAEKRLYEFYWRDRKAIRLLKVGRSATISNYPMTEVSYSLSLDSDGELQSVTVEDGTGEVIDGLLRKNDGQLWPVDPPPRAVIGGKKVK